MAQFVVVAITLVGIYYQFRQGRAANAFAQANAMKQEWDGEWMVRCRLALFFAVRDGTDLGTVTIPIGNFWENLAALVRAGHVELPVVWQYLGAACRTMWGLIDDEVRRVQAEEGSTIWEHFVWLVGELERLDNERGEENRYSREFLIPQVPRYIQGVQERLVAFEAMRTVIVAPPKAPEALAISAPELAEASA
jgi:hypothetical protein